jgi:hypothetical protein
MPCSWCDFLQRQVQIAERGLALLRKERELRRGAATLLGCAEIPAAVEFDQAIVNAEGLLTRSYWSIEEHRRRYHPVVESTPQRNKEAIQAA